MNIEAIIRIRNNMSLILPAPECASTSKEKQCQDDLRGGDIVPSSIGKLPLFSLIKTLNDKKAEVLELQSHRKLKPHIQLQEKIQSLVGREVELSENIANCLEFMLKSNQILKQALENPMGRDALPLPHHLHRKMVQLVEACIWMIQHKRWQPLDYEVDWKTVVPLLQEEVAYWLSCSKQMEKTFKEVEDLKHKLDSVIQNYPDGLA